MTVGYSAPRHSSTNRHLHLLAKPEPTGRDWRILLRLGPWLRRQRTLIGFALIAFALSRLLEAAIPLFLREVIDRIDTGNPALLGPVLGIVVCVLGRLLVVTSARIGIRQAGINLVFALRQTLFDRLQSQGATFFTRHTVGDMMTRAVSDLGLIRRLVSMGTIMAVIMIYATVIGFAAMFYLAPTLAWMVAPPLPFIAWYASRASKRMNASSRQTQERLGELTDRTQERFGGIRTLQAMAREDAEIERFEADNRAYAEAFRAQARVTSAMTSVMPTLAAVATLTVIGYGGHLVLTEQITKGTFVAFFAYVAMVIAPMRSMGFLVNLVQRAAVAAGRVFEVLDLEPEIVDQPSGATPDRMRGELAARDLTYTHPGSANVALENVELDIKAGETIAVMGRVGAGKSTLLALFARMLEPPAGSVLIDDHPVADWPLRELRRQVALVPQDAFLFAQPMRENLSYDDPTRTLEPILGAAEAADLESTIAALPQGIATLIGERGVTLSGGQRQRTTLARGLIRAAPVLLLDDCFASVDTDTEERILDRLLGERKGLTTFMVTHRVSTARRADRILILEGGRIEGFGSHDQLLGSGGWYAELAQSQQQASARALES